MKVVANTTPIISLASIGRLDLLAALFGEIIIAEAVYQEIKAKQPRSGNVFLPDIHMAMHRKCWARKSMRPTYSLILIENSGRDCPGPLSL